MITKQFMTAFGEAWLEYLFDVANWQITMMEHASLLRRSVCQAGK